jgi:hypothetical protein
VIESIFVLGTVVFLALVALLDFETLAIVGLVTAAVGLLLGTPTGLMYHVVLHRVLKSRGTVPAGWWLSPVRYHQGLSPGEVGSFSRWFKLGAIGFSLAVVGCLLAIAGFVRSFLD